MKTEELLSGVKIKTVTGKLPQEIFSLEDNSEKVTENCLFFCIKGNNKDGADFAPRAVARGAKLIVCERITKSADVCTVVVEDVKEAEAVICKNFYRNPQDDMQIVGVVGTNGKTSTCRILSEIFERAGYETGTIGTLGVTYGSVFEQTGLTSLGLLDLYKTLAKMRDSGVEVVFTEVSAHAIYQRRVEGIYFECLIFTNCTEDHLDYFHDFDTYKTVKKSIFTAENCKYAVICSDDSVGREILRETDAKTVTYGINEPADVFAVNLNQSVNGISFVINLFDMIYELQSPLIGVCNAYNVLASCACAAVIGVRLYKIAGALKNMKPVSGRAEFITEYNGGKVYLDYAHTPDGLKRTLSSFRKICDGKLICLFGCGGNREKEKRPVMGEISAALADFTVITTDNPRYEDPCAIINEIEVGVRKISREYVTIADRKEAVKYALTMLGKGDLLVVAGKGAETYQEIMGVKHDFADADVIKQIVKEMQGELG